MRVILLILSIILLSCSDSSNSQEQLNQHIWVNEDLKFDTTYADGDSSLYTIYGSGSLLLFDTNYTVKSFGNTFINDNDSITWGEPGVVLSIGKWHTKAENIIASNKLIERTFALPDDPIGRVRMDSFELRGDTLIRNKSERFLPVGFITQELNTFLRSDWSKIEKKNSR